MLATILKSKQAIATTISIVETFAKMRELTAAMKQLAIASDKDKKQELSQRSSELMSELFTPMMPVVGSETSFELNLAVMKFKHTVNREKPKGKK